MDELRRHQVVRNDDMTLLLAHVESTTSRGGDRGAPAAGAAADRPSAAGGDGCDDE